MDATYSRQVPSQWKKINGNGLSSRRAVFTERQDNNIIKQCSEEEFKCHMSRPGGLCFI